MPADTLAGGRSINLVLGVLVIWTAITIFGASLIHPDGIALDALVTRGIAWHLVLAGVFLILVIFWQKWFDVGFRAIEPGTLRLLWFPVLMLALVATASFSQGLPPASAMILVLANTAVVGFSEETMFRGILYSRLRDRLSIWPAIILTSVAFGAVHLLNGFVTGDYGSAAIQALAAGTSGLVFIAILLRTGSIWPAIIYHALWDWVLFIGTPGARGVPVDPAAAADVPLAARFLPFVIVVPNALYALWLLRNAGRELPPGNPKAR